MSHWHLTFGLHLNQILSLWFTDNLYMMESYMCLAYWIIYFKTCCFTAFHWNLYCICTFLMIFQTLTSRAKAGVSSLKSDSQTNNCWDFVEQYLCCKFLFCLDWYFYVMIYIWSPSFAKLIYQEALQVCHYFWFFQSLDWIQLVRASHILQFDCIFGVFKNSPSLQLPNSCCNFIFINTNHNIIS